MAKDLNRSRMHYSRVLLGLAFVIGFFTAPVANPESAMGELMEVLGFVLLALCAIGRIYSTAYIGGNKNNALVTEGPYSVHRNPLYFFSLLGVSGVGLISGRVTLFVLLVGGFFIIYRSLIKREEGFLLEKFGVEFENFRAATPRLFPRFDKFRAPSEITVRTGSLNNAVWDALWWLMASPVFELFEYLHNHGIVTPLFKLY